MTPIVNSLTGDNWAAATYKVMSSVLDEVLVQLGPAERGRHGPHLPGQEHSRHVGAAENVARVGVALVLETYREVEGGVGDLEPDVDVLRLEVDPVAAEGAAAVPPDTERVVPVPIRPR